MNANRSIYESGEYLNKHPGWHAEDSDWKADQIAGILADNALLPASIAEVGCGAGGILRRLAELFPDSRLMGWDISSQAIARARAHQSDRITFHQADLLAEPAKFDLIIAADVFEHVDDYLGFLRQLRAKGAHFVFHIPLDLSVSTMLRRNMLDHVRADVGHLHYFTKESALATLAYCGYDVIGSSFTRPSIDLPNGSVIVRQVRRALCAISEEWTARLLGGLSLLVLAR